jgi:AcrR family transcriptional regulator
MQDDSGVISPTGRRGRRALPVLQPDGDEPTTGRTERRDAAENRRRILAAARELVAAHGVDAVSMNQIAQAAGIGPGTLYRRFAHKGLLCAALLEESAARFHGELAALMERRDPPAPLATLGVVLERVVAYNEANGPLLGAVADAAWGERRAIVYDGPFYGWLHHIVSTLLGRAVAAGECRALDTAWFADALLAPLAIDLYLFQRRVRGFESGRIAAATRQLVAELRLSPPSLSAD